MLPIFGLSVIFSLLMCVHVVRSHNELYWIFIILIFQPLGGIIYGLTMVLPEFMGGSAARRLGKAAKQTLDPTREYRAARQAYDDAPTAANCGRLGAVAASLGHHDEAEAMYREAAQGMHADDPVFLLGRAEALVELGRHDEALAILDHLGELGEKGRTPRAAMTMGRAYEALGRTAEADDAYEWAAARYVGLEASARYAVFLRHCGRDAEAQAIVVDLDKRLAKTAPHFRKEARAWRDYARSGPATG